MDPRFLQRQIRENASDLDAFCKDLKEWRIDMEKKENKNTSEKEDVSKPKIRKLSGSKIKEVKSKTKNNSNEEVPKPKKNTPIDYSSWDKFDVEAECAKVDRNSSDESVLTDECDNASVDEANEEKEKGNGFVKKKMWTEAIRHYTSAIKLYNYDPAFYANRALCYLKLDNFKACEQDCTKAIRLDSTYVKAFHRRATAREKLNLLSEALNDFEKVLKLDPNNKESKVAKQRIEKQLEETKGIKPVAEESQRPKSKFTMGRQKENRSTSSRPIQDQAVPSTSKEPDAIKSHVMERKPPAEPISSTIVERKPILNTSKPIEKMEVDQAYKTPVGTFWPSGNDVDLVPTMFKSVNQRSKKKLKRITVTDLELAERPTEFIEKTNIELQGTEGNITLNITDEGNEKNIRNSVNLKQQDMGFLQPKSEPQFIETSVPKKIVDKILDDPMVKSEEDGRFPPPKTAVQFYHCWKALENSSEERLLYLSRIKPNDFADLFKESLSTKVFSELLATLACDEKHSLSVYNYLVGLSCVPRFSALSMFMSQEDKKVFLKLVDFMREENTTEQDAVDLLIKKYGL